MVDIHAHIIPGLDDGAECMEEALKNGCHGGRRDRPYGGDQSRKLLSLFAERVSGEIFCTEERASKNKIPMKVYPGMEIFLDDGAFSLLKKKSFWR